MSEQSVVHATFTIERSYAAPSARVFAAFADPALKRRWFHPPSAAASDEHAADFRPGGFERTRFTFHGGPPEAPAAGTLMGNDTVYLDIVPGRRIVFAYSMLIGDHRMSSSLVTVELFASGDGGTRLVFTEQGAFFERSDGPQGREGGWRDLLSRLGETLRLPG
jgi:uncharacterized protein YndB with AHSA1/START domain